MAIYHNDILANLFLLVNFFKDNFGNYIKLYKDFKDLALFSLFILII